MGRFLCIVLTFFLFAWPSHADGRGDSRMIEAVQAYTDGDFAKSAEIFGKMLGENHSNDAAWYYNGLNQLYLGNPEEAIRSLRNAVSIDTTNYWYQDRLALVYSMTDQRELAIHTYEKMLDRFPKKTDPYYSLVNLYYADGQIDKTLDAIDRIEDLVGKSDQTVMFRHRILLGEGKQDEAVAVLEDYVEEYSSPYVLTMLGDQEIGLFNDSTAIDYYDRALALDSDYMPARLGKTEVFRVTRHYPEYFEGLYDLMGDAAVEADGKADYLSQLQRHADQRFFQTFRPQLDSAVGLMTDVAPGDTSALKAAGFYYYGTERKAEARDIFKKLSQDHPESHELQGVYAQILAYDEDYEALSEEAEKAAKRFPDDAMFPRMSVVALYNMGEYQKVIEKSLEIVAASPRDSATIVDNYSVIGDMYHELGKTEEAYKAYEKVLSVSPKHPATLNNYAYYLSLEGKRLSKALKMSSMAVSAEPDNATYLDTYGWILHLLGRDAEAKSHFKHAMLYGGKDNAVILAHYAIVLDALGEHDLAEVYRDQAKNKQ